MKEKLFLSNIYTPSGKGRRNISFTAQYLDEDGSGVMFNVLANYSLDGEFVIENMEELLDMQMPENVYELIKAYVAHYYDVAGYKTYAENEYYHEKLDMNVLEIGLE